MKQLILSLAIVTTIIFTSCNTKKDESTPKEVFTKFIKALKRNDLKTAENLATPSSGTTFTFLNFGKEKLNKVLGLIDTTKLNITEPIIDGEKATIGLKENSGNIGANFKLEKINGEWKVAFDLDSILALSTNVDTMPNLKINKDDTQLYNTDSLEKILKKQMKALNINTDSFEKEIKKIDKLDLDKLILEHTK